MKFLRVLVATLGWCVVVLGGLVLGFAGLCGSLGTALDSHMTFADDILPLLLAGGAMVAVGVGMAWVVRWGRGK